MKSKLLILTLLFSTVLLAQKLPREILYGQLVSDGMTVDNILITNKTANQAAVSKNDGTFQILVRVKDTLVFSGLNFARQSLILNEADLKLKVLKIKIESRINPLDEVVINPNALTGNLNKDSQNIKLNSLNTNLDKQAAVETLFEADDKTSPDNKLMPGYLDDTYMMDFAKIGKKIVRAFKRSEAQKNKNKDITRFSVVVQNRFSDDFFRNTLKMDASEAERFLAFCDNDSNASTYITAGNDFELIAFIKQKKQEYKDLKKE